MKSSTISIRILALAASAFALQSQTVDQPRTATSVLAQRTFRTSLAERLKRRSLASPQLPGNADCLITYGTPCYSPRDIQNAYGVTSLINTGHSGYSQTIVIVVSYGSPTIEQDLKIFDAAFGLPDPPSLKVLAPLGTVPFDPTDPQQLGWAGETSLDVEWAHALAPNASIVILTSPVNETQGTQGLPEFLQLERYALDHHLGQIISQSWGTAENTLFDAAGRNIMNAFNDLYKRAAAEHVTILAGSGDSGTQNVDVNNNPYPFPTVLFPASSPFVTAVGGTSLYLDSNGNYQSETVWNHLGASGGGVSQYFAEPIYQRILGMPMQGQLGGHRGLPDVALNADSNTPVWVYFGFFSDPGDNNFYPIGSGTSAAAPQWAGIVADANQMAGRPLGFLNTALYAIGARNNVSRFFHDITVGNNAYNGLPGFSAASGWDLATGWGTPNLQNFLGELMQWEIQ